MTTAALPKGHGLTAGLHTTHRSLLEVVVRPRRATEVDGILVPTARDAEKLRPALRIARELDCPLVVLCSGATDPAVVKIEAEAMDVGVHAVSRPKVRRTPWLDTRAMLRDGPFERITDTSGKRNFGLALASLSGWDRILFLDDDVDIADTGDVRRAAGLLDDFPVVGLDNRGFADNSVVCHAHRDTGGRQETFIGSGAMLFRRDRATSFFPHVYNEDWFFLLDDGVLARCAVHGEFRQLAFNPYSDPGRAANQEFGDCLAEGLFALLDDSKSLSDADTGFWSEFLAFRSSFISNARWRLDRATWIHPMRRVQIAASLDAARGSLTMITPEYCVEYLDAWRRDSGKWRDWIEGLPVDLSVTEALSYLGAG